MNDNIEKIDKIIYKDSSKKKYDNTKEDNLSKSNSFIKNKFKENNSIGSKLSKI